MSAPAQQIEDLPVDYALAYATKGKLPVFPIKPGAKFPPLVKDWGNQASTDEATIRQWWRATPNANIGVHCASLVVVDVDPRNDGDVSLAALQAEHGKLPETFTVNTPSNGQHIYLRLPKEHPGVSNSASRLAAGIDIKTAGGYVLGVGSRTLAGEYAFDGTTDIAEAPQWLLDLLGTASAKTRDTTPAAAIADADEATLDRAREWLKTAERSVKGQGGDDTAYRVACGLRDFGLSYAQTIEAMRSDAWDLGCGWREGWLEDKPIRSAYRYTENQPGSKIAVPEDFDVVLQTVAQTADAIGAIVLRRARSLEALNPGPALWEGILPARAVFAIGALPGRSKSYLATGLAYALATDAGEYFGRKLPTGTAAVYVDVERLGTTELRLSVWCYADKRDPVKLPLLLTKGVRLNAPDTVKALVEALQAAQADLGGRRIAVVLLDSLGAALPGQELNSSGPATMAGTQLRRIRDALGCAVGVIAHSPKSGDETVAGSLHFDAIFDTVLFIRSEDGTAGTLYVKKDNGLALEEHERFTHWSRETLTAPVGERVLRVHRLVTGEVTVPAARVRLKPGSLQERAWHVLCDAFPDNRPVTDAELKAAIVERDAFAVKRGVIYDIKRRLENAKLITLDGTGRITRRME